MNTNKDVVKNLRHLFCEEISQNSSVLTAFETNMGKKNNEIRM